MDMHFDLRFLHTTDHFPGQNAIFICPVLKDEREILAAFSADFLDSGDTIAVYLKDRKDSITLKNICNSFPIISPIFINDSFKKMSSGDLVSRCLKMLGEREIMQIFGEPICKFEYDYDEPNIVRLLPAFNNILGIYYNMMSNSMSSMHKNRMHLILKNQVYDFSCVLNRHGTYESKEYERARNIVDSGVIQIIQDTL